MQETRVEHDARRRQWAERWCGEELECIRNVSDMDAECWNQCWEDYEGREAACNGLDRTSILGYGGSEHARCTDNAYEARSRCEFACMSPF